MRPIIPTLRGDKRGLKLAGGAPPVVRVASDRVLRQEEEWADTHNREAAQRRGRRIEDDLTHAMRGLSMIAEDT